MVTAAIAQLSICYPASPWIVQQKARGKKARAGLRAPNAVYFSEHGPRTFFERWKGSVRFHLLLIDVKGKIKDLPLMAKSLENQYGELVSIQMIQEDTNREILSRYDDIAAYLIRPDGYIGYCGSLKKLAPLHTYLTHLTHFFSFKEELREPICCPSLLDQLTKT